MLPGEKGEKLASDGWFFLYVLTTITLVSNFALTSKNQSLKFQ